MRVLVTGVAGFLGSHIADAMLARGHEVIGIDNMVGGSQENIPKGVKFYKLRCQSLSTEDHIMEGVDLVYHCAALAYEGLSVFSPHLVVESIVGASTAVFSAAIMARVKRIVHCSSMARYGSIVTPYRETQSCYPQDPYGIAKLTAEQLLRNLGKVHGIELVIAVPHNIIGPRQKFDDPYRNVASIIMNRLLQRKPPIIYGDGNQKRCFSFIGDCLDCLVKMGTQDDVVGEVINIGPDEEPVTINELVSVIHHVMGTHFMPFYVPGGPQEVFTALCSSDKARRMLNYETKTSLEDGLREMANAMRAIAPMGRPFRYHLPIEINNSPKLPKTWSERMM